MASSDVFSRHSTAPSGSQTIERPDDIDIRGGYGVCHDENTSRLHGSGEHQVQITPRHPVETITQLDIHAGVLDELGAPRTVRQ